MQTTNHLYPYKWTCTDRSHENMTVGATSIGKNLRVSKFQTYIDSYIGRRCSEDKKNKTNI